MQKKIKKLELNKETVRNLSEHHLVIVAGFSGSVGGGEHICCPTNRVTDACSVEC
jgi:hypothetical protein